MPATRSKKRMISSSANIENKTSACASPLGAHCQKANAGAESVNALGRKEKPVTGEQLVGMLDAAGCAGRAIAL
jgi:hypothetical protein